MILLDEFKDAIENDKNATNIWQKSYVLSYKNPLHITGFNHHPITNQYNLRGKRAMKEDDNVINILT
jgi:hypothetical protein